MSQENTDSDKIYICRGIRCKSNNSDAIVEVLQKVLKTTIDKGNDEDIQIESSLCMGHCKNGPNIKVNNKVYNQVDNQILKRVLVVMKSKISSRTL